MSRTPDPTARPDTIGGWLAAGVDTETGCPPLDAWARLASGEVSTEEREELRAHALACALCAAEEELAMAFSDEGSDAVAAADGRDVEAIVSSLEQASPNVAGSADPEHERWSGREPQPARATAPRRSAARWLAAAGVLVALVGLYQLQNARTDSLPDPLTGGVVRGAAVEPTAPLGEVAGRPASFAWEAVPGAERYVLTVLRVDDTPVWTVESSRPAVAVPAPEDAPEAPVLDTGVVYRWTVEALDDAGEVIGRSSIASFRVTPEPPREP